MKKSTLQFILPQLEEQYQKERIKNNQFLYKLLSILLLLYSIIRLFCSIFKSNMIITYWEIGFTFYNLFLSILSFRGKPQSIKGAFTFTNFILCLMQIPANKFTNYQSAYINGQCLMAFNLSFYYFANLTETLFSIFFFITSRIIISSLLVSEFMYSEMLQLASCSSLMFMMAYLNELNQRNSFLQRFSNTQWQESLPTLIQNPFLLFVYDVERLSFNLSVFNDMKIIGWDLEKAPTENLRTFLRSYNIGQETLEQYLVNRLKVIQQKITAYQIPLKITSNNTTIEQKKLIVRLGYFYLQEPTFLLVFDQHDQKTRALESLKKSLIQGINQHQNLTINFLQKQMIYIDNCINQKNNTEFIYKMKIHCNYFMGKYTQCNSFQQIENQIQLVNFTDQIKELLNDYKIAYKHMQFQFSCNQEQDIYLQTNDQLIKIFLVIIFQTLVRTIFDGSNIFVHLNYNDINEFEQVKLNIICNKISDLKQKLLNNYLFHDIQMRLSPKVGILEIDQSCQFSLYKDLSQLNEVRMLQEEIE